MTSLCSEIHANNHLENLPVYSFELNKLLMKKTLIIALFCAISCIIHAQNFEAGIRIQKTQNMYWENGVTASYSFENFKPNKFYVGFSYITSRLGTAMGSNALKQDNFLAHASWLCGKKMKPLRFYGRLGIGFFKAEQVDEIFKNVPNSAFLINPEIGLNYQFKEWPISINLGTGLNVDFKEDGYSPGTLQLLYYHLDLNYRIF